MTISIRKPQIKDYFKSSFSLIFFEIVFAFMLVFFSSILTELGYWYMIVLFSCITFVVFFLIMHLSQFPFYRNKFIIVVVFAALVQIYFFVKHYDDNIVYNDYALTIYKGFPIPYFDIMIFSDGSIRLVDKKLVFNMQDQRVVCKQMADIVVIGSGMEGLGGKGFPDETETQFIFNPETKRGIQVIILKTPDACLEFNKLKERGFNVMMILHNT